jgi:hypothetical protein
LPTLDIAERMIEETPGITRLIDRLEAKELVTRGDDQPPNAEAEVTHLVCFKNNDLLNVRTHVIVRS